MRGLVVLAQDYCNHYDSSFHLIIDDLYWNCMKESYQWDYLEWCCSESFIKCLGYWEWTIESTIIFICNTLIEGLIIISFNLVIILLTWFQWLINHSIIRITRIGSKMFFIPSLFIFILVSLILPIWMYAFRFNYGTELFALKFDEALEVILMLC